MTKKFTQKAILAIFASGVLTSKALATGIPTIDVGSLTQSILQYTETIKSNVQMLKSYSSQLEQMKEQGIGMGIGEILGETKDIINKTLDNVGFKIDEDTLQETKDITDVCAFLEQNSKHFKDTIKKSRTKA